MPSTFETVIGLEIHAEIATQSKLFCSCSASAWNSLPNEHTCPICMGFPGQLPVVNKEAVSKALIASLALNCVVPPFSKFDRKNYFYPDLVKGFQISQFDQPLSQNGFLNIEIGDEKKKIRINRLHVEDDAGKLSHVSGGSLCDYSRSGIGLMEIVSEPDIRSSQQAELYARAIQSILRYVNASEADMEKGMMRFDASVSLRPEGDEKLYPRAEIKNLNSFRSLVSAIEFEVRRQRKLWDDGQHQSKDITVGWDEEKGETYFMRDKEGADDYRYFPEPDLPPLLVNEEMLGEIRKQLPELPMQKRDRYIADFGLAKDDAVLLVSDKDLAAYFEKTLAATKEQPKKVASFVTSVVLFYVKENARPIAEFSITPQKVAELLDLVADGKVSNTMAKTEVFEAMYETGKSAAEIIEEKGLSQVSDTGAIETIAQKVLAENPSVVAEYKSGREKVFGFLVGQVMKEMKGKANPQMASDILKKLIL
ncbi:MAG: Asp-tRNA(Asn)/Glu-tRNA(Gln) amidotransferase subunit GatB [Patescibacteria group bacterium]